MSLVSLSGKTDTGKSTVGEILRKKGWVILSFSEKLKQILSIMFGWNIDILRAETPEHKAARALLPPATLCGKTYTYREAVLFVGDMLKREMGEHIVADMLVGYVRMLIDSGSKVCVTDARYCRELDALGPECRKLCLWRKESDLKVVEGEHDSENDFLKMIGELELVDNSKGLEELCNKIEEILV